MNGKAPLLDLWYPLPAQGPAPSPARLLRSLSLLLGGPPSQGERGEPGGDTGAAGARDVETVSPRLSYYLGGGSCSQHSNLSCFLIRSQPVQGTKGQGCCSLFRAPLLSLQQQGPECGAYGLKSLHIQHGASGPSSLSQQFCPCLSLQCHRCQGFSSACPSPAQASLCPLGHPTTPVFPSPPYPPAVSCVRKLSESSEA